MQRKKKTNLNHLQYMKAMAGVHGKSVLLDVKMPKKRIPRKPSTQPRKPKDMAEKRLERNILWHLSLFPHMKGIKMGDMPGVYTYNTRFMLRGLTDLLIINLKQGTFTWTELKVGKNKLSSHQEDFKKM